MPKNRAAGIAGFVRVFAFAAHKVCGDAREAGNAPLFDFRKFLTNDERTNPRLEG